MTHFYVKIFNIFSIANENRKLYIHIYNLAFFTFIQKMLRFLTHLRKEIFMRNKYEMQYYRQMKPIDQKIYRIHNSTWLNAGYDNKRGPKMDY